MTFKTFMNLLHTKYPEAEAVMHGKFGGTESTGKVEINFKPNGKAYCYYGSYQSVLAKIGIDVIYQYEIDNIKKMLKDCEDRHGTVGLFGTILDLSDEIERYEKILYDIEKGKYIVIK